LVSVASSAPFVGTAVPAESYTFGKEGLKAMIAPPVFLLAAVAVMTVGSVNAAFEEWMPQRGVSSDFRPSYPPALFFRLEGERSPSEVYAFAGIRG
jgi:hypothetical protein